MDNITCEVCKSSTNETRMWFVDGAYGTYPKRICKGCVDKENAQIRAEAKRFGFKLKTVNWNKLS